MIEKYWVVYQVTALPTVLFSGMTKLLELYEFSKEAFIIPENLKGLPIEIRVSIYDENGELVEFAYEVQMASMIVPRLNILPMQMLNKLLSKLA